MIILGRQSIRLTAVPSPTTTTHLRRLPACIVNAFNMLVASARVNRSSKLFHA
jgi:hypothetical protein